MVGRGAGAPPGAKEGATPHSNLAQRHTSCKCAGLCGGECGTSGFVQQRRQLFL